MVRHFFITLLCCATLCIISSSFRIYPVRPQLKSSLRCLSPQRETDRDDFGAVIGRRGKYMKLNAAIDFTALVGVIAFAESCLGRATIIEDYFMYGAVTTFWILASDYFGFYLDDKGQAVRSSELGMDRGGGMVYFSLGLLYLIVIIPTTILVGIFVPALRYPFLCIFLIPIYVFSILLFNFFAKEEIVETFRRMFNR